LAVLCVLVGTASASAHHSFAAEFDAKKCSEITGLLTSVDWQNPHAYVYVDVKSAGGVVESVTFQLSSIANLRRGGMERKNMIDNFGKVVTVRGCAAKNGEKNRYAASFIKFPDGKVYRLGQDVEGLFGTNN
jgi:hypothetical protein